MSPYETIPLNDDDMDTLHTIVNVRRRLLSGTFSALILIGLLCAGRGSIHWTDGDKTGLDSSDIYLFNILWLESAIMLCGLFFYFKKIHPFRKDIRSGVKQRVPYTIVHKKYFPVTQQYYIVFSNGNMRREVDEATYHGYSEGDICFMYKAAHSGYVFRSDGKFTIM